MIMPSAGVHVTLPDYYSPEHLGMIVPKTKDGRVVFMLPWLSSTIAGTTGASVAADMLQLRLYWMALLASDLLPCSRGCYAVFAAQLEKLLQRKASETDNSLALRPVIKQHISCHQSGSATVSSQ